VRGHTDAGKLAPCGHCPDDAQREIHPCRVRTALPAGQPRPATGQRRILEFDINQRPWTCAEALLAQIPKSSGLVLYLERSRPPRKSSATLKRVRPDITVILGGRR